MKGRETRDLAAERSGFGNRETYRQARKVTEHGTPELVDAMDRSEISISAAAELASEPEDEQRRRLNLPTKKEAQKQAKATGAAVLARDGKYYAHVEPEREAQTERWLSFKDILWNVADQKLDPAEIIQSVPTYQYAEFERRLRLAREFLDRLAAERERRSEQFAAE